MATCQWLATQHFSTGEGVNGIAGADSWQPAESGDAAEGGAGL